jgi:gliding motility-associated lipoprotein GldH
LIRGIDNTRNGRAKIAHFRYLCRMKQRFLHAGLFLLLVAGFGACQKIDVYEKHAAIPGFKWAPSLKPAFEFNIADSAAAYNLFIICRHTHAYAYSNLWLRVTEQLPGDSAHSYKFQIDLTNNNKEWRGAGMDDIYELRSLPRLFQARSLPKGKCTYTIEQIMYDNPLENIMNIGMRVEKIKS